MLINYTNANLISWNQP